MVERGVKLEQGDLFLPPGFRFHPTDEEVITSYLLQKFLNPSFAPRAVGEVDLNKCEPWDLPSKAKMGEKEWYFFYHKDMKYPTGMRTNRATKEGYWKATGRDKEIFKTSAAGGGGRDLVGLKKTLVFYMGRAPRGSKTNWVMHEFRLEGKHRHNANLRFNPKDEWVVCKVFHKKGEEAAKTAAVESSAGTPNVSTVSVDGGGDDGDEFLDSMIDSMCFNSTGSSTVAAAAPYNVDYISSTAAAATTTAATSSFADLPNYDIFNDTLTSTNLHRLPVANSAAPRSYSSSTPWINMLHANRAMGRSYSLQDQQAMMVQALGGVISSSFTGGLPAAGSSVTGVLQQNSLGLPQQKMGNYGESYATFASADATAAATGPAAKNLDARLVRY